MNVSGKLSEILTARGLSEKDLHVELVKLTARHGWVPTQYQVRQWLDGSVVPEKYRPFIERVLGMRQGELTERQAS